MAVLQELVNRCRAVGVPLMIWPFFVMQADGTFLPVDPLHPLADVPAGCLVLVETYPKVCWNNSDQRLNAFEEAATWAAVRAHFNNTASAAAMPDSKDEADALIAWYGLSANTTLAPTPELLACHLAQPALLSTEGWIHGV
jgi:hypothetical protein